MIIKDGIEFHNVAQLQEIDGKPGWRLQRLPDAIREQLNPVACDVALCTTGCELRVVTEGEATITLYSDVHHEYVQLLQGDWIHEEIMLEPGETRSIVLKTSEQLAELSDELRETSAFAPSVWRLKFSGTGRIHFLGIESQSTWRPPSDNEKPVLRWLAYGSSITQGFNAPHLAMPYISHAARLMKVDVFNLGFGGSCHAENALGDYFSTRNDWDLITLELGINLTNDPITLEEFEARVRYMVQALSVAQPQKPVVLLTPFPVHHDWHPPTDPKRQRIEGFRQVLRSVRHQNLHPHLHLIEGADVLTLPTGLSTDLCHPSEFGHALMGQELARQLGLWDYWNSKRM